MEYKDSLLWQNAFGPAAPHTHKEQRDRLRLSYELTRRTIAPLLNETSRHTRQFTLHNVDHSDAQWMTASMLCGQRILSNPAEVYVLGCTFLFHDAAMNELDPDGDIVQFMDRAEWRDLLVSIFWKMRRRMPDEAEIDDPPKDVDDACRTEAIRKTHASRGADLVEKPWQLGDGVGYLIDDTELRQGYGRLIGQLAASHWWEAGDLPSRFDHDKGPLTFLPSDWKVDPLKLACILRLADATQVDGRRAPSFLLALRDPHGVSRDHWVFQERMCQPILEGDRIVYSANRPFGRADASAWWQALGYLQEVDRELKRVDAVLWDQGRESLLARAVAGVDRPERFARYFEVDGWRPVNAELRISDVPVHIRALGGEQLYGRDRREVALRELVQNAVDAVRARELMDPEFREGGRGKVTVKLLRDGEDWLLEVGDNGIGMDEGIIVAGLLDYGLSGWRTDVARSTFPGLMSGGFRPAGTFGVGFYSVLMLGDRITVTTRRYDLGARDARQVMFAEGLRTRPMVCRLPPASLVQPGTVVRVELRADPLERDGLLATTSGDTLAELVGRLVLSHPVPIEIEEHRAGDDDRQTRPAFDLAAASRDAAFDGLYPRGQGLSDNEGQRAEARAGFSQLATDIRDDEGRRIGLAVLGRHLNLLYEAALGIVVLDGFRAARHPDFTGYIAGVPSRASRDDVELACTPAQLTAWITSQVEGLREHGLFDISTQLELAGIIHRAAGDLHADHSVAIVSDGVLRIGDIERWAAPRDRILLTYGGPCEWTTRPPALWHRPSGRRVTPPDGWLVFGPAPSFPLFEAALPSRRDVAYIEHRNDGGSTWEKRWWRTSGDVAGLIVRHICGAWGCEPGDLLAPAAARGWTDRARMLPDVTAVPVLSLERPRR